MTLTFGPQEWLMKREELPRWPCAAAWRSDQGGKGQDRKGPYSVDHFIAIVVEEVV